MINRVGKAYPQGKVMYKFQVIEHNTIVGIRKELFNSWTHAYTWAKARASQGYVVNIERVWIWL